LKTKQKIIFALSGFLLVVVFFAASLVDAAANAVDTYPRLPYKELIFIPGTLPSSHAPSIVSLPDGELFTVWYAATSSSSHAAIWGSRRLPGAKEWTTPYIIQETPGFSNKNPVLYLNRDKKLFLFWVEEKRWFKWPVDTLRMKVSKDLGRTWTEVRNFGVPAGFLVRTHPITLHDGRIVLPLYADSSTSSAISISADGGSTWTSPKYILFFFGIQPTIIQRSDLSLFALTRTGMWPRRSWQSESYNLGRSWGRQRVSTVKNPGCSLEMIKLKSGNVALVFNDSRTSREGLSIALSHDEGKTWPHVRVIEFEAGSINIYPSIIQDSRGLIHVVYAYDCRTSIAHFVTDEKWIEGTSL